MEKSLLFISLIFCFIVKAQEPIFNSSMTITTHGIVSSPFGEEVDKIIDGDVNTKFLDFELNDGMGFTVDVEGPYIANYIEVITANDFEVRDPMNFEVLGSNDGVTFVSIDSGEIPCISDRFFSRMFPIENNESYSFYRINYTNACDPSGGTGIPSIQLSETQLYEETLGFNDSELAKNVAIYPNPNNGVFTLHYNGSISLTNAKVIDMNGRIIQILNLKGFPNKKEIRLNNYNPGIYFIRISTQKETSVHKILIK